MMVRKILVSMLMVFTISLWGVSKASDGKGKQDSAYPLSNETVQIQGFSKYPNTVFYHVYAKSVRRIFVSRIKGDAISFQSDGGGYMHYISWDTSLSTLQQGVELSGEENPGIIQYLRLYRNDYKPKALEVPFYPSCRKISHITSYFSLNRHGQSSTNSGNKEFGLNITKRVYSGGSDQITITDKFHEMQVLIDKLTHQPEKIPGFVLTKEEAKTIRAYADSLKSTNINRLVILRKKPAHSQDNEQSNNYDKPHGILKLNVTGFENVSVGRFHLLIVGEDGLICRVIRGNIIKVKLDSDERAYITRSQYWGREKKGVLFDLNSKEYKHYKATLHPKNRNEEPLVEIPTYLIKDEKTSEVHQFEVVSQLPELAKTKDDFVIKLKEPDGEKVANLHTDVIALSEGYNHTRWVPFIINFLVVLILSLAMKYLVLLVMYQTICQVSGWDNKYKLFYPCLGGVVITLSAVWFLVPFVQNFVIVKLIVSFAFTMIIEGMIYRKFLHIPLKKAMLLTACCNLVFFLAGMLVL